MMCLFRGVIGPNTNPCTRLFFAEVKSKGTLEAQGQGRRGVQFLALRGLKDVESAESCRVSYGGTRFP